MEKKDKFNLAEVLGVEEDERWTYPTVFGLFRVHNGVREHYTDDNKWIPSDDEVGLVKMLNHPERIIHTRHLTEPELAICKAVGAKWVSIGPCSDFIMLTKTKPTWDGECNDWLIGKESVLTGDPIARIRKTLFQSVRPGDCINVEEEIRSGD